MATAQQQSVQQNVKGLAAIFYSLSNVGRKSQEVAGELAKLSEENLGAASQAAEKLRDANPMRDIAAIQAEWMKSYYENVSSHYRKITEIAASTPQDVAKCYSEFFSAMSHVGSEAINKTTDFTRQVGDQAANAAHATADAARDAGQQATHATGNAVRNEGQQATHATADAAHKVSQPIAQNVHKASEEARSGARR